MHPHKNSPWDRGRGASPWQIFGLLEGLVVPMMPQTSSTLLKHPRVFKPVPSGVPLNWNNTSPSHSQPSSVTFLWINSPSFTQQVEILFSNNSQAWVKLKFERKKLTISLNFSKDTKQYYRTKPTLPLFELCKLLPHHSTSHPASCNLLHI